MLPCDAGWLGLGGHGQDWHPQGLCLVSWYGKKSFSRWWFEIFDFHPYLGDDFPILTHKISNGLKPQRFSQTRYAHPWPYCYWKRHPTIWEESENPTFGKNRKTPFEKTDSRLRSQWGNHKGGKLKQVNITSLSSKNFAPPKTPKPIRIQSWELL